MYPCRVKKISYINRKEAYAVIKLHSLGSVQPYKCKYCGFWHLGNKIPKKSPIGKIIINNKRKRNAMKTLLELIDQLCGVEGDSLCSQKNKF